jgi:hypothetical protein
MNKLYHILSNSRSPSSGMWKKAILYYQAKCILLDYLYSEYPNLKNIQLGEADIISLEITQNRYIIDIKCNSPLQPINLVFRQQLRQIQDFLLDELIQKKILTNKFSINFCV